VIYFLGPRLIATQNIFAQKSLFYTVFASKAINGKNIKMKFVFLFLFYGEFSHIIHIVQQCLYSSEYILL